MRFSAISSLITAISRLYFNKLLSFLTLIQSYFDYRLIYRLIGVT